MNFVEVLNACERLVAATFPDYTRCDAIKPSFCSIASSSVLPQVVFLLYQKGRDSRIFQALQRLIDYGIATGYLRGRTVQRTSG
jgi:hypothetical protein